MQLRTQLMHLTLSSTIVTSLSPFLLLSPFTITIDCHLCIKSHHMPDRNHYTWTWSPSLTQWPLLSLHVSIITGPYYVLSKSPLLFMPTSTVKSLVPPQAPFYPLSQAKSSSVGVANLASSSLQFSRLVQFFCIYSDHIILIATDFALAFVQF
jgi:hypothetical protein